jgi:anti-sigma factor RsiW
MKYPMEGERRSGHAPGQARSGDLSEQRHSGHPSEPPFEPPSEPPGSGHPSELTLSMHADCALEPAAAAVLAQHLHACADCRAAAEALRGARAILEYA